MGISYSPHIVSDGLVLCLDAANPRSYPGSGSTWYDLSGNGYHCTLANTTFNTNHGGSIDFNGTDSYGTFDTSIPLGFEQQSDDFTLDIVVRSTETSQTYTTYNFSAAIYFGGWHFGDGYANKWRFRIQGTGLSLYTNGSAQITNNNNIYHFHCWKSYPYIGIYRNTGEDSSNVAFSGTMSSGTKRLGLYQYSGFNLACQIFQVKIYNRKLSYAEVKQNFNANRGRYGI
jgi:hypothetical protein